ncbi:hypothetical protein EDD22DRAFT_851692 [Suillus occidentalis]|nr:hypothetical protein EDD22DRAFT_851692 [Suillus occidentalis]
MACPPIYKTDKPSQEILEIRKSLAEALSYADEATTSKVEADNDENNELSNLPGCLHALKGIKDKMLALVPEPCAFTEVHTCKMQSTTWSSLLQWEHFVMFKLRTQVLGDDWPIAANLMLVEITSPDSSTITTLLPTSMPPPKEYQVIRKGHLQTISKSQYYRLKAQDGGANTWTPELHTLLASWVQTDAPIALSSTSVELTREHTRSIQSGDVDMNLDENATEDKGNYADDFPDPPAADEDHSTPPPDPDPPAGDTGHSTPPPDPDPPTSNEDHFTPPPDPDPPASDMSHSTPPSDPPAGDKDQRTIQDIDLDEIQHLANIGG